MKKIIVFGSNGVLGTAFKDKEFVKKYSKKYKFIFSTSKKIDLRNQKKTINYIKKEKPNHIIHLAASTGGIGRSLGNHASILRDNVYMLFNILEGARLAKTKKIILTMTTGMYPEKAKLPLVEKDIHNGEPVSYNYGNSFGKRLMEPAIRSYRDEYGLDVIGMIVSGIFGEGDNFNLQDANMLPAVIRRIVEAKRKKSNKVEIWGTGKPLREYTYSKDIRDIFIWMLENYSSSKLINISSLEEKPIKKIVKIICQKVGFEFRKIKFNTKKPDGIFRKTPSTKLLRSVIKFNFTKLEDGIEKTVNWYLKSKNINKKSKARLFNIKSF